MKRLFTCVAIAAAIWLSGGASDTKAGTASPVFGTAKVQQLDNTQLKAVVGQGTTSAYYAYLGNFYASLAIQLASYGAYLEPFGSGYAGTRDAYYYTAYLRASAATTYYYYAYLTN